mmetsp:Transcript_89976/g.155842  ORF Transcript_89976/g.155842 Transcript_89976/m.155842 type:complete len:229 (+) Transcript_89976:54-740(+)
MWFDVARRGISGIACILLSLGSAAGAGSLPSWEEHRPAALNSVHNKADKGIHDRQEVGLTSRGSVLQAGDQNTAQQSSHIMRRDILESLQRHHHPDSALEIPNIPMGGGDDAGKGANGKGIVADPDGNSASSVAVDEDLDDTIVVESKWTWDKCLLAILLGVGISWGIAFMIVVIAVCVSMIMTDKKPTPAAAPAPAPTRAPEPIEEEEDIDIDVAEDVGEDEEDLVG